jgi:protein gp37
MALNSKIEWTEATWNPATGCTKISDGCANCYAERLAPRLKAMGNRRYANGFALTLHHDLIDLPLKWREPKFVFVNSMSDLFHEQMPLSFIQSVFKTMEKADKHVFQILTKRSHF